ncbi:Autophagy protein 7 [Coelomomyces lativittatus]|nr:Autophagy protein 7 [Coelomomyces lativittatus]
MKWRLLPSLDLDAISQCKCLILGAGTLGCHVARNLLAWGVHTISLVDYGKVSYSNPVRQPLYVFEDCLGGGISKSKAASKRLKEIYPNVIVNGYDITIPMPGHPILEEKTFVETMSLLEHLFKEHDVIFILLDSREGRWLPTLLGTIGDKIVINAALGFDSFVVMRHSSKLGCYFCNDVVAPTDSLFNRTLDQQCTVTRPGLSAITGAYAVEMLASIMNHPQRHHAASLSTDSCLGILPQQLRGFLNTLETLCISGEAYPQCTACSTYVQKHYEQWGLDFIRQVCNDSEILESITGLNDIKNKIDSIGDLSLSDDDFDCS